MAGWRSRAAAVTGFPNPISDMLMGVRILPIECLNVDQNETFHWLCYSGEGRELYGNRRFDDSIVYRLDAL